MYLSSFLKPVNCPPATKSLSVQQRVCIFQLVPLGKTLHFTWCTPGLLGRCKERKPSLWLSLEAGISPTFILGASLTCYREAVCAAYTTYLFRESKETKTHLEAKDCAPRAYLVLQERTAWLKTATIKVKVSGNT